MQRKLWIDTRGEPVITTAPNGERNARRWGWVEAEAIPKGDLTACPTNPKVDALRDDLAFNMCRVVDWRGTVQSAYERGVRLQIELPPGAVLTGLARRVFEQGTVTAFDSARLDTLQALLREEGGRQL